MFAFDQVRAIASEADRIIGEERNDLEPFYATIENYVAKFSQFEKSNEKSKEVSSAGIFVGGSLGVNMLLGKPRTLSDYVYFLYSQQALRHANQLTNLLAEMVAKSYGSVKDILAKAEEVYEAVAKDPKQRGQIKNIREPKIVMMKTALPYQRYIIYVDARVLVQFTSLPHGSASIVKPTLADSLSTSTKNKLFVISPEVQLLDLYRVLYSPAKVGEWREAMRDENNLYQHLKKRLPELKKTGSDNRNSDLKLVTKELQENIAEGAGSQHDEYKLHILSHWVTSNPNVVLIGDFAIRMLLSENRGSMVQVITQKNPEEDAAKVCGMLEEQFNIKCSQHTRPLSIMQDFRLQRTTVRADEKEVLYIYNCGAYDFIPFNLAVTVKGGSTTRKEHNVPKSSQKQQAQFIQVGNPFVLLRFLLVDFWTVRLLNAEGKIDAKYAQLRLDEITRLLLELRSKISELDDKSHTASIGDKFIGQGGLLRTFPSVGEGIDSTSSYMGVYEDEIQAQKNLLNQGARRFNDYYPDEALIRNGKYLEFGSDRDGKKDGSCEYTGAYDVEGADSLDVVF